jgi:Zn-dependent protease with chaperone function
MHHTPASTGFLSARVLEREQLHRRSVVAAVAALVVFSTSPVFGHHLAEPLTGWLAGRDHLLNLCLIALHEMLEPVHETFHLLVAGGLLYAVADRLRAVWRLRQALGELPQSAAEPSGVLAEAASAVGVPLTVVRVVHGCRVPAFTAGLWRPRIFVADALATLPLDELAAVIAHEDAHRRRRDPLRLTIWRFLACMLFFLPALRWLADDIADEAEVAADDDAVTRAQVQPLCLASALVTIAQRFGGPTPAILATATAFHRAEILGRRVRRLAGEDAPIGTHLTRRSTLGAALALAAVWVSGLIVAHPLPAYGHTMVVAEASHAGTHHCRHEHAWAVSHLFCRGFGGHSTASSGQHCPHDG